MTTEFGFELNGIMPILFHADDVEAADRLSEWRKDPANKNRSAAGDDRSPPWTWQTYLYSDGEHVAWPSENLMVCLRSAGAQITLKRQKTFKELSQSGLLITSEFCDFYQGEKLTQIPVSRIADMRDKEFAAQAADAQKLGFKLFVKRARVGTSKHIRVRARFDKWSIRGRIAVLSPDITPEILKQLFDLAGRVGLGDWRPGCKTPGPFGMFAAEVGK